MAKKRKDDAELAALCEALAEIVPPHLLVKEIPDHLADALAGVADAVILTRRHERRLAELEKQIEKLTKAEHPKLKVAS